MGSEPLHGLTKASVSDKIQKLANGKNWKTSSVHVACCHESDQEDNISPDFESDSDLEFMSIAPHKGYGITTTTYHGGVS